jgi:uncharacterized membrane protein (UPF0127 family)
MGFFICYNNLMKKSILITIAFLAIGFYIGFTGVFRGDNGNNGCFITLNNQRFDLTLAQTPAEQEQGLSGTASLPANTGKLFVFEHPDMYGFWMKDMNYAIDIIWFDENLKIVGIAKNTTPKTYPNVFYPNKNSQYVLEINAGDAEKLNLGFDQSAQLHCQAVLK